MELAGYPQYGRSAKVSHEIEPQSLLPVLASMYLSQRLALGGYPR